MREGAVMAIDTNRTTPAVRVLVVDDFEPFRRVVCSILGKIPNLQIVGEASDGREAVRKAQELLPDLILLDIGLPTLNGIAAARQIRSLLPLSKIIFVTQESSPDIVEEAINLGAQGYVVKIRVAHDLLSAVEAVLDDRQFVNSVLSEQAHNASSA
jgi:DNA-binding NarL/FixJ family response regulator